LDARKHSWDKDSIIALGQRPRKGETKRKSERKKEREKRERNVVDKFPSTCTSI
jgi:hypothetical protein